MDSFCRTNSWPRAMGIRFLLMVAAVSLVFLSAADQGRAQMNLNHPPIDYMNAPVDDPVARLQKRLNAGEVKLRFDAKHGYLPGVLELLQIDPSSQMLVFSKTSFQLRRISHRRPRAIYFNDSVYVGWVQRGNVIEFSSVDPRQGAIFYTLDVKRSDEPRFVRQTHECLACHAGSNTRRVPGHFVRSVFTDRNGQPILNAGTFRTDYTSPLKERWGGWYVTGTHGDQRHMGNVAVQDRQKPERLDVDAGANATGLEPWLDTSPYLSPHSDIVALMVLEYQVTMHNQITAANYSARRTLRDSQIMNEALERPADFESDSINRRYDIAAKRVAEILLMVDEHRLTAPIRGVSQFTTQFQKRGPFDLRGRSLRQLDLNTRLFRYPFSYLVYSESFDALPDAVRRRVWRRVWNVLTGQDKSAEFTHLSTDDRLAIMEILRSTKSNLPDYWQTSDDGHAKAKGNAEG